MQSSDKGVRNGGLLQRNSEECIQIGQGEEHMPSGLVGDKMRRHHTEMIYACTNGREREKPYWVVLGKGNWNAVWSNSFLPISALPVSGHKIAG
jgi:hypothetical protein